MLSKENITVTLRLIHCMLEITLGVKTCMRQKFLTLIRIDVKSNVHKKKGLNKNANIHRNLHYKISE